MATINGKGVARLSVRGKRSVAESMYAKGKAFLGAAVLLRQKGGYEYVVLHLICQGMEVALKGLLLAIDYDQFNPRLRTLGHDLIKVAEATTAAARLPPLRRDVRAELETLNRLYSRHLLRYASAYDIMVDPASHPTRLVLRRMIAVLRLVERKGVLGGAATTGSS